nr:G protein-coupled receptor [Proales similis]
MKQVWLIVVIVFLTQLARLRAVHLRGTFDTRHFFKFLTRFGSQKTDLHNRASTRSYIYGNVTLLAVNEKASRRQIDHDHSIMLVVTDLNYFREFYSQRRVSPRSTACSLMFKTIESVAFYFNCNENGAQDFIRRVPCPVGSICIDEDYQENVIKGHQFTFKIDDPNQARFWYVSLVACSRDTKTCRWNYLPDLNVSNASTPIDSYIIGYDIWLVNGNPDENHLNPFEHQFSYEMHDIIEIYLLSFVSYLLILPTIILRTWRRFHWLYFQLSAFVTIELASRLVSLIHWLVFAFNGSGLTACYLLGQLFSACADCVLMLNLVSIANGWTVRSHRLRFSQRSRCLAAALFTIYTASHLISLFMIHPVFNLNSYENPGGYVELTTRLAVMCWFLAELKNTSKHLESAAVRHARRPSSPIENAEELEERLYYSSSQDDDLEPLAADSVLNAADEAAANRVNTSSGEYRTRVTKLRSFERFYLHFGACSLVWFIYFPILIAISIFLSDLYRLRLIISIKFLVNFMSALVLMYVAMSPVTPLVLPGKKNGARIEPIALLEMESHDDEEIVYSSSQNNLIEN